MDDNASKFLAERVKSGLDEFIRRIERLREDFIAINALRQDIYAFQLALAALTRETLEPYRPKGLPDVSLSISGGNLLEVKEEIEKEEAPATLAETNGTSHHRKKPGRALDFSNDSPTGVVRRILHDAGKALSVDEMEDAIPAGLLFKMTRDNIHRALPRMIDRGEISRVGRGEYIYNENFQETED